MSRLRGQIPEGLSVMTRSRVVRKSLNPLLWQTWVFGWYLILGFRYKLADRVNARSESFARWIRWPLGAGRPDRWREVHVIRVGGIGDSLMSTSALRLLKQIRPQIRIVFYAPFVQPFRGLPFLDEVRSLEDCSHPSAVVSLAKRRRVRHAYILCRYRDGVVEYLYEGSIPPRRHIARIFGDQLGLDVGDVRPSCVFDEALIRQYQEAWAHLPRPWIVVNRKPNRCLNKDLMGAHWDRLIASLLNRYTVIEIGTGRGRPGAASALCGPEREAPPRPLLGRRRRRGHPRRPDLRAGARRRRGRQTVGRHLWWL